MEYTELVKFFREFYLYNQLFNVIMYLRNYKDLSFSSIYKIYEKNFSSIYVIELYNFLILKTCLYFWGIAEQKYFKTKIQLFLVDTLSLKLKKSLYYNFSCNYAHSNFT